MKVPTEICALLQDESAFRSTLHDWLKQIPLDQWPPLSYGEVEPGSLEISILSMRQDPETLYVRLQVWFRETLAGSSCGFEASSDPGYAVLLLQIDRSSGVAVF